MDTFYIFDEYGDFQFTTTDEDFASAWCDENAGYYCCNQSLTLSQKCDIIIIERKRKK